MTAKRLRAAARQILCLALLATTSACQPALAAYVSSPPGTGTPLEVTATSEATATPEATAVPLPESSAPSVPASLEQPAPNHPAPETGPLEFVFPDQQPEPASAWRPPLYPVPWAPTPYDHFFFTRPIAANETNWPLEDYRYGGVFFEDVVHTGVDIPAPVGTPVLATGPGRVTWAGYGLYALKEDRDDPYGLAVAIKHDFGWQGETLYTVYGHMDQIFVSKGQRLEGGEVIGTVGTTGKTTGAHLHYEVRVGKNNFFGSRNPELWMSPPQGWGILAARVTGTGGIPLYGHELRIHSLDTDQWWKVKTYGAGSTNSDPYYRENMVIGDLPAGRYQVRIGYGGRLLDFDVLVQPGMVSYFIFQGRNGFKLEMPPPLGADFTPEAASFLPSAGK